MSASSGNAETIGPDARGSSQRPSASPISGQLRSEHWQVLERIARGAPLGELLLDIVDLVEHQAEGMSCSLLVLDAGANQLRHGAARRLDPALCADVDGTRVGPNEVSCGAAAFRRERVIATDIATHPSWEPHRDRFVERGLRACWSTPILAPGGELLGTIGMYLTECRAPTSEECAWVDAAAQLAAIALSRDRAERALLATVSELREKNRQLEFHVNRLPLGYVVWSRELAVTEWNGAAERIFGRAAAEVVGKRSAELAIFAADERAGDPLGRELSACPRGGARSRHEHINQSGARVVCEWLHSPLLDSHDQVVGYLSLAEDVTERQRGDEERARLEAQLRQSQRIQALGTLAGGIAHDFNNILTAISGHTHLGLIDIEEERSPQDSLLAIQDASARAVELVRRILMFSRYQRPERRVCSIAPIVDEAVALLRARLPSGVALDAEHCAALLVNADPAQIQQVLMNLGVNALHAIGASGQIEVLVDSIASSHPELTGNADQRYQRYVRISMSDTGSGMDDATLERIFEPFFTTKPTGQGAGLGLSVVHSIVKGHEGHIDVQSKPGKGSVFRIYLPEAQEPATTALRTSNPTPANARVMYVDDEEPLVVLAKRWLGRLGYNVTGFSDSSHALEAFRARPFDFDAVISDLSMPGLSGMDLIREIVALRRDVVIVMSSGYVRAEDRELAKQLGAVDVVLKPQSMAEFGRVLHGILERRAPEATARD